MSAQIRFLCPTCKSVMEAPIDKAGNKINCLKCGQRLQIPPPEHAKTVLASGLGVHDEVPKPKSKSSAQITSPQPAVLPPVAKHAPPPPSSSTSVPITRTPSQAVGGFFKWVFADWRLRWLSGLAVGLAVLSCTCMVGITAVGRIVPLVFGQVGPQKVLPQVFGPKAAAQGKTWSNKEMIEHLHAHDLKFKTRIISSDEVPLGAVPLNQRHLIQWETLVIMYPEHEATAETALQNWVFRTIENRPDMVQAMKAKDNTKMHEAFRGSGLVFFGRSKSEEKMKEDIRKATQELLMDESAIHSWGLFSFYGDPDEIVKIKKAL